MEENLIISEKSNVEVGDAGGDCTCGNDQKYKVGVYTDNPTKLACVNGIPGPIGTVTDDESKQEVICLKYREAQCYQCEPGYTVDFGGTRCVKNQEPLLEMCRKFALGRETQCEECQLGWYQMKNDNTWCEKPERVGTTLIQYSYCKSYANNSNNEAICQCYPHYTPPITRTATCTTPSATSGNAHCVELDPADPLKCSLCFAGYILGETTGECTAGLCSAFTGCLSCSDTKCLLCDKGYSQIKDTLYDSVLPTGDLCVWTESDDSHKVDNCRIHQMVGKGDTPWCYRCDFGFSVITTKDACAVPTIRLPEQLEGCRIFSNEAKTDCAECYSDYQQFDFLTNQQCLRPAKTKLNLYTLNILVNLSTDKTLCNASGSILEIVDDNTMKIGNLNFAVAPCQTKPKIFADITIIRTIYGAGGEPKWVHRVAKKGFKVGTYIYDAISQSTHCKVFNPYGEGCLFCKDGFLRKGTTCILASTCEVEFNELVKTKH
jgi:hypothetical protein